ncbi:MAG: hypothetical protein KA754_10370 [Corallincola sp.]|nr:hypothetical protein [Corallincola sp.]
MSFHPGLTPHGQSLCRAIRYLSDFHLHDRPSLEEVALRFDLSPLEQEFLLRYFANQQPQR